MAAALSTKLSSTQPVRDPLGLLGGLWTARSWSVCVAYPLEGFMSSSGGQPVPTAALTAQQALHAARVWAGRMARNLPCVTPSTHLLRAAAGHVFAPDSLPAA